ncbi:MAG: cupin domain-containing protein [Actinomycetota bacterium]
MREHAAEPHGDVEMINPVTGSRIALRHRVDSSPEDCVLEIEAWLPQTWRDPWRHNHPLQEERVVVLGGELAAEIDGWSRTYSPGEAFIVPAGIDHSLSVRGGRGTHVITELTPPLRSANLHAVLYGLAVLGLVDRSGWPKPMVAGIVAREFERELVAAEAPLNVRVRTARALLRLGMTLGYETLVARLAEDPPADSHTMKGAQS